MKNFLDGLFNMERDLKYKSEAEPVKFKSFDVFLSRREENMLQTIYDYEAEYEANEDIKKFIEQFNQLCKYGLMKRAGDLPNSVLKNLNFNCLLSDEQYLHVDVDYNKITFFEHNQNKETELQIRKDWRISYTVKSLNEYGKIESFEKYDYGFNLDGTRLEEKTYSDGYDDNEYIVYTNELKKNFSNDQTNNLI